MASSSPKSPAKMLDKLKNLSDVPGVSDLVEYFTHKAKLETSEEVIAPQKVRNVDAESAVPKLQRGNVENASRDSEPKKSIDSLDAKTGFTPATASDMLQPYASMSILYLNRRIPSTYVPSSIMMYHIVHHMDDILTDSRAFRRACPDYHPYIFRLYCGILFWIQTLRVCVHVGRVNGLWHQFLMRFLETHPLESLPVPTPLITLFKSISASQPELREYGFVAPRLPENAGPSRRDAFIRDDLESFILPNVPGIIALLVDLNDKINAAQPTYPAKYSHSPVGANAVTFGFHQFAAAADRSEKDKWSLISPGLEHPCEADKKLHEVFAERYATFGFPPTAAADDLRRLDNFLHMNTRTDWFGRVKDVAAMIAVAFKGSGTLADCAVSGVNANQYVIHYSPTDPELPAPTKIADPASIFPLSIRASTSVRSGSQLTLALGCEAQTNIVMPTNHPFLSTVGTAGITRSGYFWDIQPIETSEVNDEGYVALRTIIRSLFEFKR